LSSGPFVDTITPETVNCEDSNIDNKRYARSGDMDRRRRWFEHIMILLFLSSIGEPV
jgi:hypothetical protein